MTTSGAIRLPRYGLFWIINASFRRPSPFCVCRTADERHSQSSPGAPTLRLPLQLFLSLALLITQTATAQQPDSSVKRPLPAVKTDTPPKIDGDLSDPAWKTAPKADRFYDRQQGSITPDLTEAWLTYDAKYLYVAFYCHDSQPDKIVARETVRDQKYQGGMMFTNDTEDNVEVTFDAFLSHNENDFSRFSVNPLGTRSAKISGGRAGKAEWKGDWDAAIKRVKDGWTAEMRIPWAILNYPNGRAPVTMGINFWRYQQRTQIQSVWSNVGQNRFMEDEGLWQGVSVPVGTFKPHLSLLPYVMPGFDRSRPTLRTGLDARYAVTPELTAVSTINPDFGTIEGAIEGIQFSRSERFVPERRPFFLEGRDYFNAMDMFGIGQYFYSNRINGFDLGSKVYGKVTPTDTLGFLHAIDFNHRSDIVTQYRHDISPTHSATMFFTQRTASDDNNTAGFLTDSIRWGKFGIDTNLGKSGGRDAGGEADSLNFSYGDKNNFTSLLFANVAPNFRDVNGLIPFVDYRGVQVYEDWNAQWRKGFFRSFDMDFYPDYMLHRDGRPFKRGIGTDLFLDTRSDLRFRLSYQREKFDSQTDETTTLVLRQGVSNRFRRYGFMLTTGRQADRPYSFIGPEISMRVLKKLDLAYAGAVQSFEGHTQQHILTMNYEFSPSRSFGGRVVVQDSYTNWYVSYRSSGERGMEIYFIIGDPNALRFKEQVRVKFVFAI